MPKHADPTYVERVADRTKDLPTDQVLDVLEAVRDEKLDPEIASAGCAEHRDDALLPKAKERVFRDAVGDVIRDHKNRRGE